MITELTETIRSGAELDTAEISQLAESLLDESVDAASKADLLTALSVRGETAAEIAGLADEFLARAVNPGLGPEQADRPRLDVCGTGGDKLNLFNVSTTSVFVLAAAGIEVVKHGNRGITSKSGGADVLEALGIRIDLPPEQIGECLSAVGAAFLFAPLYHPAFKAVVPVRKMLAERGQRTVFNLLGPLLNPVRPSRQLIGVFDPAVGPVFAEILKRLGREEAWVVHGLTDDGRGMDELSSIGPTQIWKKSSDGPIEMSLDPSGLGLDGGTVGDLAGDDAEANAAIVVGILDGSIGGPKRDMVSLNSAAGLVVAGKAVSLEEGLTQAGDLIDSGKAIEVLERWQAFSSK
ncbi:MAG: anthranilate phosphoribosyltransferase [Verrucomicrobiota bacterium]